MNKSITEARQWALDKAYREAERLAMEVRQLEEWREKIAASLAVPPLEDAIEQVRIFAPHFTPEMVRAQAMSRNAVIERAAAFEAAVTKKIFEMPVEFRPYDQGRSPGEEERKKLPFKDIRWSLWRRWPWIAVWEDGYDTDMPPWERSIQFGRTDLRRTVQDCLHYCLARYDELPRIAPVGTRTAYGPVSAHELPKFATIVGPMIPHGIVKLYSVARTGEALAFVFQVTGTNEMDQIRRLIAAPSPEKIAEAFAISTGSAFRKAQLSIQPTTMNYVTLEKIDLPKKPETLQNLRLKHPKLLRISGVPNKIMAKMLSKPNDSWSVLSLAGGPSGGARKRVSDALPRLVTVHLVKQDGDQWTLGENAWTGQ